jgi:hypothetical protein|tara:strand:- start:53 stop:250 length:198 start_codon:yes stop_codon:yes gene_type:complete
MVNAFEEHYSQLIGWTVKGLAVDNNDPDEQEFMGLIMERGSKQKIAWVLMDPEGNGPGFLDIQNM